MDFIAYIPEADGRYRAGRTAHRFLSAQDRQRQYELQLMVLMKSGGDNIAKEEALSHVYGYGTCLDMTRRAVLDTAEGRRSPWKLKKSFDHSAPCGPVYSVETVGHPSSDRIALTVGGKVHQDSDLNLMNRRAPEIIATLAAYGSSKPSDGIIRTGRTAWVPLFRVMLWSAALKSSGS